MAINKEYIFNYLGDKVMWDIYKHFLDELTYAYKTDIENLNIEPTMKLEQYIDEYVFGEMAFPYAEMGESLDDFLLKKLGDRYDYLRDMYEVFYEYASNRFRSYRIPMLYEVILDKAFWKPLKTMMKQSEE
jgi:hypothetical protein